MNVLWLAVNAKYSHTSLAVRYLRECVPGSRISELSINEPLLDMLGAIADERPQVLGIACYIWNIEPIKQLLRLLAEAMPDLTIICGGPEVSYDTKEFMTAFPMVDFVVRGEGEEVCRELAKRDFCVDEDIPGLAWRGADGTIHVSRDVTVADLTAIPFPYRDEEMDAIKERILYYETTRGCPFSCAYCLSCATAGVRFLPLERVFRELDFFVRHDVRQVKFVDRTFNAKKSHFLPILKWLLALPDTCRTNFHFEVAIDYLDDDVLDVMSKLPPGRIQLEIGIQSTNEKTLAAVSRVNHWEEIQSHIRRILSFHNMHLHVDLIAGLPGEGLSSFHQSFNDVYALQTDMLQLGFLKFLRGATMMHLVRPYHYRYMPMAPYEVLASDALTYPEILWLKRFEAVFEYYYNAGRCRKTASYLIAAHENGDAFAFWQHLTDWWIGKGYHRVGHATKNLYAYLMEYAQTEYGEDECLMDNLLRYDALLADNGRIRPTFLAWNMETYQYATAPFWRGETVTDYLPGFVFKNWRDVRTHHHIEVFDVDVRRLIETGERLDRKTPLLFSFTPHGTTCQTITLEGLGNA